MGERRLLIFDKIDRIRKSTVQHGPNNDRAYLLKLHADDAADIVEELVNLTILKRYTKIIAKVPEWAIDPFLDQGFTIEANVPKMYNGNTSGYFLSQFFSADRSFVSKKCQSAMESVKEMALAVHEPSYNTIPSKYHIRKLEVEDIRILVDLYRKVFKFYPFPIFDESYLNKTMDSNTYYFGVFKDSKLVAASSALIDSDNSNAQLKDFASIANLQGKNLSYFLLQQMELSLKNQGIETLYAVVRAISHTMNMSMARCSFNLSGTLVNNTLIGDRIESMNVWYKNLERR